MTIATFGTFFLPGPTEVRAEVLQAMTQPMMSHRGRAFEQLYERAQAGLQPVFSTRRPVYIGTCSATGFMEAGVRCAAPGAVLALVNGAFSERFAHIAAGCGRSVDRYVVPWGDVHESGKLAELMTETKYAAITVVHSETSTGALNDIHAISDVAHTHGAACLVDSVSGAGGTEIRFDDWGMDFVLTGSQKALALPPGLAFAVASAEFIERAVGSDSDDRGVYFDLGEFETYTKKHQTPNTPALSLLYALDAQSDALLAEGMEARWIRHTTMAARTVEWVCETRETLGIEIGVLARKGHRSPTVTAITLPGGLSSDTVVTAAGERGITIGTGYGKLKGSSVRIGHMGDHTLATLETCLDACTEALEQTVAEYRPSPSRA